VDDQDGTDRSGHQELDVLRRDPKYMALPTGYDHRGWPDANDHYRTSCHCWAMYLRILRRHLEHGESVPYEKRLDV
jgi:hypothetical protein